MDESINVLAGLVRLSENRDIDQPRQQIPIYGDTLFSALVNAMVHGYKMSTPDTIFIA
jgi:hypothetical protein